MNKTIKTFVLCVTFCFIIIILLSIPIGNNIVPNAYAYVDPEPTSLSVLSLTGIYFALKTLKHKGASKQ